MMNMRLNIEKVLSFVEKRSGRKLPRDFREIDVNEEMNILFIRFREPESVEIGEPLDTEAVAILFTDEKSGEITALEVVELNTFLREIEEEHS